MSGDRITIDSGTANRRTSGCATTDGMAGSARTGGWTTSGGTRGARNGGTGGIHAEEGRGGVREEVVTEAQNGAVAVQEEVVAVVREEVVEEVR